MEAPLSSLVTIFLCLAVVFSASEHLHDYLPTLSSLPAGSGGPRLEQDSHAFDHPGNLNIPGAAIFTGRRRYQEDRLLCVPHLKLPPHGTNESYITDAALYGVFDGHLGDQASDLASKSLKQLLLHHASSLLRRQDEASWQFAFRSINRSLNNTPSSYTTGNTPLREALQEALRQAVLDLDLLFSKEASKHGSQAGSTACVAVLLDEDVLIANVGDSKALMCSRCATTPGKIHGDKSLQQSKRRHKKRVSMTSENEPSGGLCVQELTNDHRPDRIDEKARIEAAGGFITQSSLSRVNGQLAVSRSIGDVPFKKYGVTSEPEFSGWQRISNNDSFLVLASDGIFEKMSPQDVCNVLHAVETNQDVEALIGPLVEGTSSVIALPSGMQDISDSDFHFHLDDLGGMNNILDSSMDPTEASSFTSEDAVQRDSLSLDALPVDYQCKASSVARIMAQALVKIAYQAGSMDNLSALVVPLRMSLLLR